MLARGRWGENIPDCTTWYDPYREQNEIDQAIWWQLSQKIDTSMTCGEPLLLDKVLSAGFRFKSISEEEQEVIDGYHKFIDSMHDLKGYASYDLHGKKNAGYPPPSHMRSGALERYEYAYDFIKNWVGGETLP